MSFLHAMRSQGGTWKHLVSPGQLKSAKLEWKGVCWDDSVGTKPA